MLEIPRRKLLGMTMAVFGFFTTQSRLAVERRSKRLRRGQGSKTDEPRGPPRTRRKTGLGWPSATNNRQFSVISAPRTSVSEGVVKKSIHHGDTEGTEKDGFWVDPMGRRTFSNGGFTVGFPSKDRFPCDGRYQE